MAIPTDRNTSAKVTEKLSKYKDLEIEIERMWGMKTKTIPVVIGVLGLIKKGMDKYILVILYQNSRAAEDHTARNVPHLKKGTIHQVDFNLVLNLGLRTGPVGN